ITNPPYGERMGEPKNLPTLYRTLGGRLREHFTGWRAAILVAETERETDDPARALGLRPDKSYALFNGAIACRFLVCEILSHEKKARERKPLSSGDEMVKNRIDKNLRHLKKWLVREQVSCFRVYDADLPEYAAAIDVYRGFTKRTRAAEQPSASRTPNASHDNRSDVYLHIQEYAPPPTVDAEAARVRLRDLLHAAGDTLEVPREHIALKVRSRDKGGAKYGRFDTRDEMLIVEEGGLHFEVNLFDHLDTGLFLDHRNVRALLRELARGRHFLNLFAYTGSASVYAASGNALDTTSVDLSTTYLEWASRNLALNGFDGRDHRLAQADALTFLREDRNRYGLIYVDPPTFSNSKRAADFDVQRDHVHLLTLCRDRLDDEGVIVFSNNARRFHLDGESLSQIFTIEDRTRASLPPDFSRRPNIHGCWLLRPAMRSGSVV
ncbi:MAG: bifunctional 23S rRNA (guanine(2069)-N(7))-methyltransferase RlmK/23S rRNA (guanine(2445)-N(2))-methyltransferase RlmL, partial [Pseudomonadota bacterium]|nr:bifunctional 23S rRNA (guanine(2069)-N(7))-methyltransferase RlmK/23S rRNA (guanine(2445)-N(2))-methyltransferase RlmL [Pseudomonadota bacterium]